MLQRFIAKQPSNRGINYESQESTPTPQILTSYFDASIHPPCLIVRLCPTLAFCFLNKSKSRYLQSTKKWKKNTSFQYCLVSLHMTFTKTTRCVLPGWAVVTVEAPCQWWNGPKDDLPMQLFTARGNWRTLLRGKITILKNWCLRRLCQYTTFHHFPFAAWYLFIRYKSCRVCAILRLRRWHLWSKEWTMAPITLHQENFPNEVSNIVSNI